VTHQPRAEYPLMEKQITVLHKDLRPDIPATLKGPEEFDSTE